MGRKLALVSVIGVLVSACTQSPSNVGATPVYSPGPAFDLVVNGPVACPQGANARLCLSVTVTNHGMAGDGECTLYATVPSTNGDQSVTGPRLRLTGVRSGTSVDEVLAWTKDLPTQDHFFVGDCNPAPQS